jgi:hypothetical protein
MLPGAGYRPGGRWQWLKRSEPFGETRELEDRPRAGEAAILAFRIPEAPYSDEALKKLHKAFEVADGVVATVEIFGPELVGLGAFGLGLTVLGPLAALAAGVAALGAGYADARAKISKERQKTGFAEGFVIGADSRSWKYAKSMFWEDGPEFNAFDPQAGSIAQKAFNLGLASGFVQGRKLTGQQRKFFWQSIGETLTQGDRAEFAGDSKQWPDRLWVNWYITVATRFIKLYVKD